MKLGIRLKLFLVSVALIGASFAVAYGYLRTRIETELTSSIRADLFARAALIARDAAVMTAPAG